MINKINMKPEQKIRTVKVNERGQIVIPEEIRKDFGISSSTTLVLIEKNDSLVLRKEQDVLHHEDDSFWKALSKKSLVDAWGEEDNIWDTIYAKVRKK